MDCNIQIIRTGSDNKDFRKLIVQLDSELLETYQDAQAEFDRHNIIELIKTVIIAYVKNIPVGCGCFKIYDDDTVEIKRMFVTVDYRGQGISRIILMELETWALELGYNTAILETGNKQTTAIGLYQKSGYLQTENYGPYKKIPISICYKKAL